MSVCLPTSFDVKDFNCMFFKYQCRFNDFQYLYHLVTEVSNKVWWQKKDCKRIHLGFPTRFGSKQRIIKVFTEVSNMVWWQTKDCKCIHWGFQQGLVANEGL